MNEPLDAINARVLRCTRCPELRRYCAAIATQKKRAYRDWIYWGKPVPSFGDKRARVMILGLAPGAHGSNRTGRMFTGDGSGVFLYRALYRAGFANQASALDRSDGLILKDCIITAALHCAPPQNKPTPQELRNCFSYLRAEFATLNIGILVALGSIALRSAITLLRDSAFGFDASAVRFGHGSEFVATSGERQLTVISSFHPSQQNTNTGKLTEGMFDAIFNRVRILLAAG